MVVIAAVIFLQWFPNQVGLVDAVCRVEVEAAVVVIYLIGNP